MEARSPAYAIIERLRSLIHRGELRPGDRLPAERELAENLGVGRITLREALGRLQAEGYLVTRRGAKGGTFVTELSLPRDRWLEGMRADLTALEDILEFRIAVEQRAARLACQRRTRADLTALRRALRLMEQARDLDAFRAADAAFHGSLALAARSPRLVAAVADARGQLFLPTDSLSYPPAVQDSLAAHRAIAAAVVARDEEGAAALVERHITATRDWLRAVLRPPAAGSLHTGS